MTKLIHLGRVNSVTYCLLAMHHPVWAKNVLQQLIAKCLAGDNAHKDIAAWSTALAVGRVLSS